MGMEQGLKMCSGKEAKEKLCVGKEKNSRTTYGKRNGWIEHGVSAYVHVSAVDHHTRGDSRTNFKLKKGRETATTRL